MSCADDKRGVRAFRRAKTACRLCNKFAGLQRALNGIGFARSFGYARGGFGYFSMFQRHVRLISFIIRQQQRQQQADAYVIQIPRHTVVFLRSSSLLLLLLLRRTVAVNSSSSNDRWGRSRPSIT